MTEACIDCRFYRPDDVIATGGWCHRYAPRPTQETADYAWPYVAKSAWCGEFEARPTAAERAWQG